MAKVHRRKAQLRNYKYAVERAKSTYRQAKERASWLRDQVINWHRMNLYHRTVAIQYAQEIEQLKGILKQYMTVAQYEQQVITRVQIGTRKMGDKEYPITALKFGRHNEWLNRPDRQFPTFTEEQWERVHQLQVQFTEHIDDDKRHLIKAGYWHTSLTEIQ